MKDAHNLSFSDLAEKLQVPPAEQIDFRQTDTETTLAKVRLLSAVATYLNTLAITGFGGRLGAVREAGLVDQVAGAAFQTYEGMEMHPDPFEKAAMLMRGITQGHPFEDANKRTGFLLAIYYLERMGYPLPRQFPIDEVVRLCVRISAGKVREVAAITRELRGWWSIAGEKSAPE